MVASLTLFDGWIQTDHEEHLSTVFVRQQEETEHCRRRNLVIEGLSVKLDEGVKHFDVVATSAETQRKLSVIDVSILICS